MEIQNPREVELTVKSLAAQAGFGNVEQYVLNLIHRDVERAAIQVGLDEAQAGRYRSFRSFDAEFCAKNGIPSGS